MTDWRKEWFAFDDMTYLNAAWQGPLPRASALAVTEALEWKKYPYKIPDGAYFSLADRVRALVARLINGEPDEVALTTGASSGLASVALGLGWKPDDEVLVVRGDFVAHLATWAPLAQAGRLRLNTVVPRGEFVTAEDFLAQIGPHTRLVSASLVQPYDGALLDARTLVNACHAVGALLLLDVSQCLGAMPLDVRTLGADFVTCAAYKWLLGPYGTGFFWVHPERIAQMLPGPVCWSALEGARNPGTYSMENIKVARGAYRWDTPETGSFFNLSALSCSLEFLLKSGVQTVWEHNRRLIADMIEQLPAEQCVLASPRDPNGRGPFVCIKAQTTEKTTTLYQKLRAEHICVSLRNGALRVSPHLYNTKQDTDRLLASVAE